MMVKFITSKFLRSSFDWINCYAKSQMTREMSHLWWSKYHQRFLFDDYHHTFKKSTTTGATNVAGTVYPSVTSEFAPVFTCISGGSCCSLFQITCVHVLSSMLWCTLWFLHKNDVQFVFTLIVLSAVHVL